MRTIFNLYRLAWAPRSYNIIQSRVLSAKGDLGLVTGHVGGLDAAHGDLVAEPELVADIVEDGSHLVDLVEPATRGVRQTLHRHHRQLPRVLKVLKMALRHLTPRVLVQSYLG